MEFVAIEMTVTRGDEYTGGAAPRDFTIVWVLYEVKPKDAEKLELLYKRREAHVTVFGGPDEHLPEATFSIPLTS